MPTPNLIGQQIHHYEILSHLGGGGMGVVYKAKDTKLGRTVALKFLAPQLTSDPGLKKRFIQEAKAASALDHPNIGVVHDINETQDGRLFITMAYYEGETLKDKIAQGPIPVDQAMDYVAQIAKGLAKAHEADIVHRDIKPANIIITKDNTVKIVDFGLAKMTGETQLTKTGSTIGTIAYMSPEQLKGEEVDHRTDIWSLGVVLYEMVVGERPYKGEYEHQIIYQVLHDEADMEGVPGEVRGVLEMVLQNEVDDRFLSAKELLGVLLPGENSSGSARTVSMLNRRSHNGRNPVWIGALISVMIIGVAAFLVTRENTELPATVVQQTEHEKLTFSGNNAMPALSPDGELVAYLAVTFSDVRVLLQEVSGGQTIEVLASDFSLNGNDFNVPYFEWAPGGDMLGVIYMEDTHSAGDFKLTLYSRLGSEIRSIPMKGPRPLFFTWAPDASSIVYAVGNEVRSFNLSTFELDTLWTISEGSTIFSRVTWSPDGKYLITVTEDSLSRLWSLDVAAGKEYVLKASKDFMGRPRWSSDGSSVYFLSRDKGWQSTTQVWKQNISTRTGEPLGEARLVVEDMTGAVSFTTSADDRKLVYETNEGYGDFWVDEIGEKGSVLNSSKVTASTSVKRNPTLSPDGSQIAALMRGRTGTDVFTIPVDGGAPEQQTFIGHGDIMDAYKIAWNREGNQIAYVSRDEGIDGTVNILDLQSGEVSAVVDGGNTYIAWGPGSDIVYDSGNAMMMINPRTKEKTVLFITEEGENTEAVVFAPDGQHFAYYASQRGGPYEVWIYSLSDSSKRRIYTTTTPDEKLVPITWSDDGEWIYAALNQSWPGDKQPVMKLSTTGRDPELHAMIDGFYDMHITPDGSKIVANRWVMFSDIYIVENFDPEVE